MTDRRSVLKGMACTAGVISVAGEAQLHPTVPWWKRATIYQIYPRSFQDSNGDGIGDLPGITSRLDYIKGLGIDAVWLSPHFASPNADNGYDISDYCAVMPEFGSMADFDTMLAGMKDRGIRLILDLVVNHSSDEHAWFTASRASRNNPYRDFYIWRDGKGDQPPNNYPSFFGGPAWTRDETTGQWYLHYFGRKQPDLNWENPAVRDAVYDVMRFWLEKGVAGFRMDVIPFVSKQPGLPDLSPEQLKNPEYVYASGPKMHEYMQEMRREVLAPYGAVAIGEAYGVTAEAAQRLTDSRRGELDMVLNFDVVRLDRDGWRKLPLSLPALKKVYARLNAEVGPFGWNSVFQENHDNPRAVSHFGDDDPLWWERSAKALAVLLLTQPGTPFIYQGEEIGMTNYPFREIGEFNDVEVHGQWKDDVETGKVPAATYLWDIAQTSRDNARTPMQWSSQSNAGFTRGKPWMPVNPNFTAINAATQTSKDSSVLGFYRRLIRWRSRQPDLAVSSYVDLLPDHPTLFLYRRGSVVVAINLSRQVQQVPLTGNPTIVLASDDDGATGQPGNLILSGWTAAVVSLS